MHSANDAGGKIATDDGGRGVRSAQLNGGRFGAALALGRKHTRGLSDRRQRRTGSRSSHESEQVQGDRSPVADAGADRRSRNPRWHPRQGSAGRPRIKKPDAGSIIHAGARVGCWLSGTDELGMTLPEHLANNSGLYGDREHPGSLVTLSF